MTIYVSEWVFTVPRPFLIILAVPDRAVILPRTPRQNDTH